MDGTPFRRPRIPKTSSQPGTVERITQLQKYDQFLFTR
jgi:hypothetical protein